MMSLLLHVRFKLVVIVLILSYGLCQEEVDDHTSPLNATVVMIPSTVNSNMLSQKTSDSDHNLINVTTASTYILGYVMLFNINFG